MELNVALEVVKEFGSRELGKNALLLESLERMSELRKNEELSRKEEVAFNVVFNGMSRMF